MRFSAKSEYALRALADIADHYGKRTVGVKEVATRQEIPERFLEQQITVLRKAGIVVSQRGAQGGIRLAKAPDKITMLEVIEALEGSLAASYCVNSSAMECQKSTQCAVQDLWCQVSEAIQRVLKDMTLAQLVERQESYDKVQKSMYFI